MKKELKKLFDKTAKTINKNLPTILTTLGIVGFFSCAVSTGKGTYEATLIMNEKEAVEHRDNFTKKEVVQATWKCYIPALIWATTSTACVIGANSVHGRRNAALVTAYNLSEKALKDYRQKTVETIGPRKEQTIRDSLAKQVVEEHPVIEADVWDTGHGNTLCHDPLVNRYFRSDAEYIRRVVNLLNKRLLEDDYVSLNDFYYEMGLPESEKLGYNLGWDIEKGLIEMNFSSQLTDSGKPCLVMDYMINPKWAPGGY